MRLGRCAGLVWILVLGSCATKSPPQPSEFLDDRTGATITVVREPLQFWLGRILPTASTTGYVSLTAASVDHSGEFQLYLVGYIWPPADQGGNSTPKGVINLLVDGREIILQPTTPFPKELRDRGKLHAPAGGGFEQFAYPVTVQLLQNIADSRDLSLRLPSDTGLAVGADDEGSKRRYDIWTDTRPALKSFVREVHPQPTRDSR